MLGLFERLGFYHPSEFWDVYLSSLGRRKVPILLLIRFLLRCADATRGTFYPPQFFWLLLRDVLYGERSNDTDIDVFVPDLYRWSFA